MKNKKKIILGIVVVLAVMLLSVTGYKLLNKKGEEDPEILRSRTYQQVEEGDEAIDGTDYVTFDAYYLRDLDGDGYAEKLRGTCREVGTQDTLYMDLNVLTNGTLEDAKITINGKNFYFSTAIVKDSVIAQDYVGTNTKEIKLNNVTSGTQKLIFGMVQSGDYTREDLKAAAIGNDTNKYSIEDNTITLTGTHVSDNGERTEISKTVYLTNDWHGTTRTELYMPSWIKNQEYDIATAIDETNQKLNLTFKVNPRELDKELIINKNHVEVELPLINGYAPTNVSVKNQNTSTSYDENTRIFTIESISTLNESGYVTSTVSRDIEYEINVEYPLEAYTTLGEDAIAINIPIKAYYEGYNNENEEFENPYKSNVAEDIVSVVYKNPEGENARVDITVGEYVYDDVNKTYRYVVSKELPMNIYNQVDTENEKADEYVVRWYLSTGTEAVNVPIKMKETPEEYTDKFLDTDGNYIDMEEYVTNTGIYFVNAGGMLGEDGYINVYNDETGELLHTFTKDDWNRYSENNPYRYETPVKHIRVETSNISKSSYLYVYNVKEIDDVLLTARYTQEEFQKLNEIYSYLTGYMVIDGQDTKLDNDTNYANYEMPYSVAKITSDPNYVSNQETKKGVKINIEAQTQRFNTKKWSDGEFLVKYPAEIIDVSINSVISNDKNVTITGVDTYEENGNIYTKIYTSNEVESNLSITIDADITADPREATATRSLELYYYNPVCHNYYDENRTEDIYDVNGNENTQEYIGYTTSSLNIIAPSNLLTSQTATNFDDKGSIVVAPQEATVDKVDGTKTATVNVNVTNNYSNTISEVKIVGKIPFKGNTYQLNGADLGSQFDTQMVNTIQLPEEIKQYATVYYSEKEEVTEDIEATKNGWTTTPEDMSKVKSYLIDLGEFVMPVKNTYTFSYDIQIPSGLNYNEVSYADHAVYYCLDTDQGKLQTQTEPNKLGFRIAEKYDLEITKYQTNTDKVVSGVVFSAQEVGQEESKTAVTYSSGIATIRNLYVEREYVIKEIRTNDNYILNDEEIRIIGHVVDGKLQIEVLDGEFKDAPVIEEVENNNTKVKVALENEVKYNFELNKTQTGTEAPIQGIRFELRNENTGNTTRYTTNRDGKLTIKLLEPNVQYTLTETESQGHYLKEPVSFMMVRGSDGNLKFNVLSGDLDSLPQIDMTGEIPVVRTGLSNEKIPTYSLKITKKETDTDTTIAGAQFKLIGENKEENVLYTTDESGVVQIDNLYQYVEGKDITGVYTLQEIYPTEGYILNETPVEFRAQKDGVGNLKLEIISGQIRENVDEIQVDNTNPDNPVISITIDNDPVFTLTKVDAETGEPLEGVGFEITDLDGNPVTDANGNIVGVTELGKITFTSTGEYPWTQNEDGTWQSGNYNVNSSTSTLASNEFTVEEKAKISFDWTVSSENANYDYLYYTITNLDTNETIGGTNTKIGGTSYGIEYDSLKYNAIEEDIEPGKYKIEFVYRKDSSSSRGLDRGYIKNIKLTNGERGVKTDKDGKIRLSLVEGLYKAIETQPLEGYATPELYTGIGIGESKEAEYSYELKWENSGNLFEILDGIVTEDRIIAVGTNEDILCCDLEGNTLWFLNDEYSYDTYVDIIDVNDGFLVINDNGILEKYDYNGTKLWEKSQEWGTVYGGIEEDNNFFIKSTDSIKKIDLNGNEVWSIQEEINDDTILTCSNDTVYIINEENIIKYDFNGNLILKKDIENLDTVPDSACVVDDVIYISLHSDLIKISSDGNVISVIDVPYNWAYWAKDMIVASDGIIVACGTQGVYKVDWDGNVIWNNDEISNAYVKVLSNDENIIAFSGRTSLFTGIASGTKGTITYLDLSGNIIWNNYSHSRIAEDTNYDIYSSTVSSNEYGVFRVGNYGAVVRYDYDGNLIWVNREKTENNYTSMALVEDGIIAIEYSGSISKYSFDGRFLWEKNTSSGGWKSAIEIDNLVIIVNKLGHIFIFDSNGNMLSDNSLGTDYKFNGILEVENNNYIVYSENGQILKYNLNGDLLWEINDNYNNICATKSENGFIIGTDDKVLCRYDFNGNKIWETNISYSFWNIIYIDGKIVASLDNNNTLLVFDIESGEEIDRKYPNPSIRTMECTDNNDIIVLCNYEKDNIKFYERSIKDPEIPESQNVIVENEIVKYKITTKVEGYGGNISGKDEQPYEEVRYMEDSIKDIIATPSDGYKVQSITINGESIDFVENSDGTVKLDKFYQMTEDKEVVVSFVKENNSLIINKVDSTNNNPLLGATFNIKQLETREEPAIEKIAGQMVANGASYESEDITLGEKVNGVLSNLTNGNDTYYFVEENGKYVPNNSGVNSTTANSYVKIDLTNYTGKYAVVVNANISSESGYDYGYATITENTTIPAYSSSTGRFMYISGTTSTVTTPTDYIASLDGGKVYYLHLGYRKDGSGNSGEDKLTINSVNLYNATANTTTNTYNFVDNRNGGYESNNQGQANTTANSYIPIDLTNYTGRYNLIVNANVSSSSGDYGYATVTTSITAPAYNNSTGRFIYESGTTSPQDYTTILEGGKMYYLHLGYYKNASSDSGEDKFTVNSINITLNQDDFVDEDITTNSSGEAVIELSDGRYQITEVEAPEGYTLNTEPIIYDFVSGQENSITVENDPQVDLIVHHYIKDTTTPVAPDEYIKGDLGKEYSTSPKTDLEEYELVKNEDGSYQIPPNASGTFKEETQVVTYYYEKKPLQLIVHHYIDGTEDSVAPDEVSEGEQGQEYTTSPVEYPELDEKYELVQEKLPENASGTLEDKVTEVTYYYRVKEHKITTEVDGVGGSISGEGQTPYETVLYNEDSVKDIVVTPNSGYEIESITINGEEQQLPEDKLSEYTLDKFINMTEDKHIVVKFKIQEGSIEVYKVWEDNNNEAGKRPQEIEIQLYNGSTLVSSIKMNEKENGGAQVPTPHELNEESTEVWKNTFENIPMYDENGQEIEYTVVEKEINTNDLYFYDTDIVRLPGGDFIITNTFNVPDEKIDIEVTKVWEDNGNGAGKRPQEIKLQVKNGETVVKEQTINVESGNEQKYTFTDLSKYDELGNEIKYTVDEVEVNTDGLKFYSKTIDNDTHTITNTFTVPDEKTSIEVTKKWEDNSNLNETRPSKITIQIKNGEAIVQSNTVDVTDEDEKVYTFEDLAKYDENGQEIEYIVDETEVNKDELIGYEKRIEGKVITNTLKSHNITTEVKGEGGSISGQNEDPYEEVLHKGDSVKDIVITLQEGYEIAKITINGEEQKLPEDVKQEYTLDKFKEVTEDKHVVVEFKKIEHKITTEVLGVGGTISGQGDNPYESVAHGENSIKDIICTPENGYRIESITVNEEPIEFTENEDGTYTLDKFINMTEDKHIIVRYVRKDTSVIVKHVTEDGVDLVEPEIIEGKVGDTYNTEPKEFDDYEIKIIPENADGVMEEEQIEVVYVYSQIKGKVTITKVDKDDTSKLLEGATYKIEKLDEEGNIDNTFVSQEKTTGENGQVEFVDLTVGKYKITEIKAPQGYELNKSDIEVEITKEQRELSLTATNMLKLELPETGSINNTIIIAIVGIAVMVGAVTLSKKIKLK